MNHRFEILSAELHRCQEELQKITFLRSVTKKTDQLTHPSHTKYASLPHQHFKAAGMNDRHDKKAHDYIDTKGNHHKRCSTENPDKYWPTYVLDPTVKTCPPWADPEDTRQIRFHENDGKTNRTSHHGPYQLVPYIFRNGNFDYGCFPINPVGKTGISGRGQLGKWGPNHAADPIVTCITNGKLSFIAIQRGDTNEWALPGGMVEAGDSISTTIRKEFGEEAMDSMGMTDDEKQIMDKTVKDLFRQEKEVYRGYVDDPRNTDNAWMETVAMHVHVTPEITNTFKLKAGDDAKKVMWKEYTQDIMLYASHAEFMNAAIKNLVTNKTPGLPVWIINKFSPGENKEFTSDTDHREMRR
jgi:ADP-ribose pyrophosphatase